MTRPEFVELVEYITDRFGLGRMKSWEAFGKVFVDFEPLASDQVWEALLTRLDSDPKAEWPPTPPALRAAALELIRYSERHRDLDVPEVPAIEAAARPVVETYGWAEFSMRTYGEVIPVREAVERKAKEKTA